MSKKDQQSIDIIQQTKKLVRDMDEKQRFAIAREHLENALGYKAPRLDTYSENMSKVFMVCYNLQTSGIWQTFLLILAYIFMYLVVFTHKPATDTLFAVEWSILLVMWIDVIM